MNKIFNFYTGFANKLLAKKNQNDLDILISTRFFLYLWSLTNIITWFYVYFSFMAFGAQSPVTWGGAICTIIMSFTPFIFKLTQSFTIAGLQISLSGLVFQVLFCVYSGGIFSPAAIWLAIHPVILSFFGSFRIIIFSVLLNVVIIIILFFYGYLEMLPANVLPDFYRYALIVSSYVGLDVLVAAFMITAIRINAEQKAELRKANDLTEKKSQNIQNLVVILVHDISNSLSKILGRTMVMKQKMLINDEKNIIELPMGQKDGFNKIMNAAENINQIIDNVRNLYATELGKTNIVLSKFDLLSIFNVIKENYVEKLEEKNIEFKYLASSTGIMIESNHALFTHQILGNLVSNAIKFSRLNAEILFEVQSTEKKIVIIISDNGIGIPKEMQHKLFELKGATTRAGTSGELGTGFGLPIVKAYVERLGGTILVESRCSDEYSTDTGTKFILEFPQLNTEY